MPLVIWAALGIARQVYGANLSVWLLRLRVLRWIFWTRWRCRFIRDTCVQHLLILLNRNWALDLLHRFGIPPRMVEATLCPRIAPVSNGVDGRVVAHSARLRIAMQ